MGELTLGKIFFKNDDGVYVAIPHITEAQIITEEIEPLDNYTSYTPDDYIITMNLRHMNKKVLAILYGWKAKGPMRMRELKKAWYIRLHQQEAIPWK